MSDNLTPSGLYFICAQRRCLLDPAGPPVKNCRIYVVPAGRLVFVTHRVPSPIQLRPTA